MAVQKKKEKEKSSKDGPENVDMNYKLYFLQKINIKIEFWKKKKILITNVMFIKWLNYF